MPDPKTPVTPGHEIVGRIDLIGPGVEDLHAGERVGVRAGRFEGAAVLVP
jgi:propanol-preferring alcohol dehydrogenase